MLALALALGGCGGASFSSEDEAGHSDMSELASASASSSAASTGSKTDAGESSARATSTTSATSESSTIATSESASSSTASVGEVDAGTPSSGDAAPDADTRTLANSCTIMTKPPGVCSGSENFYACNDGKGGPWCPGLGPGQYPAGGTSDNVSYCCVDPTSL